MPSYTDEQKRRAIEMVEECGGSVTRAMRRLGYPTRQTLCQWLNQRDASHERRSGRPWSHYDSALKAQAVAFVRSSMAGKDVAEMLGCRAPRWSTIGRDIRCAREPGQPRLPGRGAQRAVAHRHHGVRAAGRQGAPVPDPRLLRRRPARLVDRHVPERGARQQQPRGRMRHALRGPAPRDPFRSRVPLPLARMDSHMREEPPDQVDVEEGVQPGQLGDGGILRQA